MAIFSEEVAALQPVASQSMQLDSSQSSPCAAASVPTRAADVEDENTSVSKLPDVKTTTHVAAVEPAAEEKAATPHRPAQPRSKVYKGQVKFFMVTQKYGFIMQEDGTDVFVHANRVIGRPLARGDEVTYEIQPDERSGKMVAYNVRGGTGGAFDVYGERVDHRNVHLYDNDFHAHQPLHSHGPLRDQGSTNHSNRNLVRDAALLENKSARTMGSKDHVNHATSLQAVQPVRKMLDHQEFAEWRWDEDNEQRALPPRPPGAGPAPLRNANSRRPSTIASVDKKLSSVAVDNKQHGAGQGTRNNGRRGSYRSNKASKDADFSRAAAGAGGRNNYHGGHHVHASHDVSMADRPPPLPPPPKPVRSLAPFRIDDDIPMRNKGGRKYHNHNHSLGPHSMGDHHGSFNQLHQTEFFDPMVDNMNLQNSNYNDNLIGAAGFLPQQQNINHGPHGDPFVHLPPQPQSSSHQSGPPQHLNQQNLTWPVEPSPEHLYREVMQLQQQPELVLPGGHSGNTSQLHAMQQHSHNMVGQLSQPEVGDGGSSGNFFVLDQTAPNQFSQASLQQLTGNQLRQQLSNLTGGSLGGSNQILENLVGQNSVSQLAPATGSSGGHPGSGAIPPELLMSMNFRSREELDSFKQQLQTEILSRQVYQDQILQQLQGASSGAPQMHAQNQQNNQQHHLPPLLQQQSPLLLEQGFLNGSSIQGVGSLNGASQQVVPGAPPQPVVHSNTPPPTLPAFLDQPLGGGPGVGQQLFQHHLLSSQPAPQQGVQQDSFNLFPQPHNSSAQAQPGTSMNLLSNIPSSSQSLQQPQLGQPNHAASLPTFLEQLVGPSSMQLFSGCGGGGGASNNTSSTANLITAGTAATPPLPSSSGTTSGLVTSASQQQLAGQQHSQSTSNALQVEQSQQLPLQLLDQLQMQQQMQQDHVSASTPVFQLSTRSSTFNGTTSTTNTSANHQLQFPAPLPGGQAGGCATGGQQQHQQQPSNVIMNNTSGNNHLSTVLTPPPLVSLSTTASNSNLVGSCGPQQPPGTGVPGCVAGSKGAQQNGSCGMDPNSSHPTNLGSSQQSLVNQLMAMIQSGTPPPVLQNSNGQSNTPHQMQPGMQTLPAPTPPPNKFY
ncbi:unnamed protein product [Amoebophrya sp. A120]|nr:unnamed protein product [Amoebophrya sp. A120]|eukprot:GSA120T00022987001.1